MTDAHIKLTLVCPPDLGDQVVQFLLEAESVVHGFTTYFADGHGHDFATASITEKVRGRVRRMVIVAVLRTNDVSALVGELRQVFTSSHMVYWTEPVSEFGGFA